MSGGHSARDVLRPVRPDWWAFLEWRYFRRKRTGRAIDASSVASSAFACLASAHTGTGCFTRLVSCAARALSLNQRGIPSGDDILLSSGNSRIDRVLPWPVA